MAYGLFLPRRWTRQPQGPVEVDWGNPISRGLAFLAVGFRPAIWPRRITPTLSGSMRVGAGAAGVAVKAPAVQSQGYVSWAVPLTLTGDYAFAVVAKPSSEDGVDTNALVGDNLNSLRVAGSIYTFLDNNAPSSVSNTAFAGKVHLYGASRIGNTVNLWRRGENVASAVTGTRTQNITEILVGRDKVSNNIIGTETYATVLFSRSPSASEWRELWDHPWQLLKPRRPIIYSLGSAGAVHELAGDATAGASAAGSLTTGIQLDGDASAGAIASGDLTTGIPLAGDAAAAAQASGTLSTEIRLAAAALVSATATGSLSTAINLAGSAAFASLAGGALTTQIRLAGAAIAGAVADAGLSTQILLDADAQAGADASGELTTVPSGLAGDAVAGATASGALSVQIILAGDALAAVLASGDLTTAGAGAELAGDATVLAIASGGLTTAITLTGAPVISVTASGELSIGLSMTAEALATVSASAVLSTQIRMEGAAVASALAAGALTTVPSRILGRIGSLDRRYHISSRSNTQASVRLNRQASVRGN